MAWQEEVGSSADQATSNQDMLTKLTGFLTSQKVATALTDTAGTGYVVDEVITLTHAGAFLDAHFVVTSVGGSGEVTGLRIATSGAFSNRITSAVPVAAGNGYEVGDILELRSGVGREAGKVVVDTLTGGAGTGVATVSPYETGGSYASGYLGVSGSFPGAGAPTLGVGPSTFAGDEACTITATATGLIGLNALGTTSDLSGTGFLVDITLEDIGWSITDDVGFSGSTNNYLRNGVEEKQVRLIGDAIGRTNKPYCFLLTGSEDVGLDTRHYLQIVHGIANASADPISQQVIRSPGLGTSDVPDDTGSYILFPPNEPVTPSESDFWISADDVHFLLILNENPTASTDDARYFFMHGGFLDPNGTENEDPYPAFCFGSSHDRDADPDVSSDAITGLAECRVLSNQACAFYYRTEVSAWELIRNSNVGGGASAERNIMFPFGVTNVLNGLPVSPDLITVDGNWGLAGCIKRDRTVSTQILGMTQGSTAKHWMSPLHVVRGGTNVAAPDLTSDRDRGAVRGAFWIYNADSAGLEISNFSEDVALVGAVRHRIFHTHVHTQRYHYVAIKEDV